MKAMGVTTLICFYQNFPINRDCHWFLRSFTKLLPATTLLKTLTEEPLLRHCLVSDAVVLL